ncbi:YdcF family protein [Parvularcula sp. LCG005]|uniref:YdcF family protein n=1 Tax=Parvularcula sp. LCG005 TaxID=3078805 RepID=UPI002943C6ED|nr:YdcF family protein [Parvularcula sp. LCG005]WOI52865.1 YdcF family protein [Parvularcula sp. LCG005]
MHILARITIASVATFIAGFLVFAGTLPRASHFNIEGKAAAFGDLTTDQIGIVALTGGGGARITRAVSLFEEGKGDRVLVSGTHPKVTKSDLKMAGSAETLDCCVDLSPWARSTVGNGIDARDWAKKNGYAALYIVTSDFHLRRATQELRAVAPELMIVGVPVENDLVPEKGWLTNPRALSLLGKEYIKFLLSFVRTLI